MRFWPQKKWKKILLSTLLIVLVVLATIGAYLEYSVYREVPTQTVVLNSGGAKTALIIYHPGLTDFARNVSYSFAHGLISRGWRVEIATASPQAPTNLANISLLVLGWPIYDFNPGPTITNQVHRMGNLNSTNTIVMVIAGGMDPLNAQANMDKIVQNANGTVIKTLQAFRGGNSWQMMQAEASKLAP